MRIVLINPAHPAVSSRCHHGRMPPLGHLAIGGALLDAGHHVQLIDAEIDALCARQVVSETHRAAADVVMVGHSGSTSAHPAIVEIATALKESAPDIPIIYGGVFPSYHTREVLSGHAAFDVIVRGEGEATAPILIGAMQSRSPLSEVRGIGYRDNGVVRLTEDAPPIIDLDSFRVGWELIGNWDNYHYWGAGRAAVVQFSRGCPHLCSYCGQRGFWVRWRHRDPMRVAAEIGWLHRHHGVRFVDLADENPTTSPRLWRTFLEELIAQNVPVQLVATIRASDIVRDAEILHLYKKAGLSRILMGIETVNRETQVRIHKGSTTLADRQAIQLLREHDILSQVAYVAGFEQETDRDLWTGMRQLLSYDPDQINAMYVTPHRWTPFHEQNARREVVEPDQSRWDYRHQVLATAIPPWRIFLWMKLTEAVLQLRPRAMWRVAAHRDRSARKALRWCYGVGARAWLFEVRSFLFRRRRVRWKSKLSDFWTTAQNEEQAQADRQPLIQLQLPAQAKATATVSSLR